ncbi:C-type lectin mannose-binding isoform-like [Portunus trituberculatus]|uniref:C-type lectin mannose-binding isoform-like n=1 Tax=Portunus trituberculatus TaxID=210409 RepID=UPI001E1D1145|nr:C-type lectin mannose-binding isoform-like [Portunus trituberculatus]
MEDRKMITALVVVWAAALVTPTSAVKVSCNGGFVLIGGTTCIKVFENQKSWKEASDACRSLENFAFGSPHLARINDCSLLSSLFDYVYYQLNITADLWLGGTDSLKEGEWEWENGDPVPVGIPFWHPLQPDGGLNENKLVFAHNGFFADGHEDRKYGYICQYQS